MNASESPPRRFVSLPEAAREEFKGRTNYWLCRPDVVAAERLQVCQATVPPGEGHDFHYHPDLEEVIYVLSGEIEQWVERERRILKAGELAHIPAGLVHATFNPTQNDAVFLAILSPGAPSGPFAVDVSGEAPWRTMRERRD